MYFTYMNMHVIKSSHTYTYNFPLFLARKEITFEVATFGGSLLFAFLNTCEILSLLSKGRYFRGVVTLGTLQYITIIDWKIGLP